MRYTYLIATIWTPEPGTGGMWTAGRTIMTLDQPLTTAEQIIDIERQLKEVNHARELVMTHFQLLRKER